MGTEAGYGGMMSLNLLGEIRVLIPESFLTADDEHTTIALRRMTIVHLYLAHPRFLIRSHLGRRVPKSDVAHISSFAILIRCDLWPAAPQIPTVNKSPGW